MGGVIRIPLRNTVTTAAAIKKHYITMAMGTPAAADTYLGGEAACFTPGEAISITKVGVSWKSSGTAVSELDAYLVKKNANATTSVAFTATGTTTVATYQTNSATTATSIAATESFYIKVPTVTTATMVTAVVEYTKG